MIVHSASTSSVTKILHQGVRTKDLHVQNTTYDPLRLNGTHSPESGAFTFQLIPLLTSHSSSVVENMNHSLVLQKVVHSSSNVTIAVKMGDKLVPFSSWGSKFSKGSRSGE